MAGVLASEQSTDPFMSASPEELYLLRYKAV
jgi:hypothetical protein